MWAGLGIPGGRTALLGSRVLFWQQRRWQGQAACLEVRVRRGEGWVWEASVPGTQCLQRGAESSWSRARQEGVIKTGGAGRGEGSRVGIGKLNEDLQLRVGFPRMTRRILMSFAVGRELTCQRFSRCLSLGRQEDGCGKKRKLESDSVAWCEDLNSHPSSATS